MVSRISPFAVNLIALLVKFKRICRSRELRSIAEEGARLGVSKGWLYQEVRAGRFPHVRLGSRILLDVADVDQFLRLREVTVEEAMRRAEEDEPWA